VRLLCCITCLLQLKRNVNAGLCDMYLWTAFVSVPHKKFLLTACSLHAELINLPDTSRDFHVVGSDLHLALLADMDMLPWPRPLLATK